MSIKRNAGRRSPLRLAALGAALVMGAGTLAACGSSNSSGGGSGDSDGPISIALSNYYSGNNWRKQMVQSFVDAATQAKKDGVVDKFDTADSNGSIPTQISQIQSMILGGYDAIVIDAASPTALNGVIQKACDAGITVVVFDSLATADCAYKAAFDYEQYGEIQAQYMVDNAGESGNYLMVRGIAGNTVDTDIYKGVQTVLSKYPGWKKVGEVYGQWTESVAEQQVQSILPTLPKLDAVLTEGNDGGGALKAITKSGSYPKVPLVIQGNSGQGIEEWLDVVKKQPDYKTISISSYPSISTVALWMAEAVHNGEDIPKTVGVPLLRIQADKAQAWADKLSYAELANTILTQDDTKRFIQASVDDKPVVVDDPTPQG
jgi:ribose transport system substrate-binding protein